MNLEGISDVLKVLLQIANVVILGYALYKFMNKPRNTLEDKVKEHEVKIREIEESLKQGNDRFRNEASTIEVIQMCMLALLDFELSYCSHTNYEHTEDLIKAKNLLQEHLARKKP